jgi:hypothetical protein
MNCEIQEMANNIVSGRFVLGWHTTPPVVHYTLKDDDGKAKTKQGRLAV